MPDTDPPEQVNRVGVKAPIFSPEDADLWFAQMEAQFALAKVVVDETKFYYVTTSLEPRYAKEVKDIIKAPPATDKYLKIKTELIKRLSASQEKRVKQLLMHEELGDRKPSQFLRHLNDLAGPAVPAKFLSTLWSSRLPQNIQTILALQMDLPLEKLGELADKVHEIAPSSPQVAMASSSSSSNCELRQEISELRKRVEQLTTRLSRNGRSHSRSRYNRNRSNSRSRPKQPPSNHPHCFYHFNFGEKAQKCKQPCTFKTENYQGGRK